MKAVILAAGKSTRTYPLTLTRPKPLLKVAGKTLLEHNLDKIIGSVDEVIIIVGYKQEMIRDHLGEEYKGIKIIYVEQTEQLGTGHAIMQAESFIDGRFLVMMGDDLYGKEDVDSCLRHELAILGKHVSNWSEFGVIVSENQKMTRLVEKPKEYVSDLANTALYVLDERIFSAIKEIGKSERGEYELTCAVEKVALARDIIVVETDYWIPIGFAWKLLDAERMLSGKGCVIGDNCVIEGYIKNSVIGDNVRFSGRISSGDSEVEIGGKKHAVNFGAIIGDGCMLEDVRIEPGTLIWPGVNKKNCTLKGVIKE